jgi:hypothetical protein
MGIPITDLPAHLQDAARRQLGITPAPRGSTRKGPTKTELAYALEQLHGLDARYEAITFHMANGHRYSPDWSYWRDGKLHCVEVKGSYRLGSYQRARLAFDQAAIEWPDIVWVWAEKQKGGGWLCRNVGKCADLPAGGQGVRNMEGMK